MKQRVFTNEFKCDAVRIVETSGRSILVVAGELGIGKSTPYAEFGIPDLWVIDATAMTTRIHREPAEDGYRSVEDVPADTVLAPLKVPRVEIRISDAG